MVEDILTYRPIHDVAPSLLPFYLFTFNLILGAVSKTEPAPKLKSIAGLIVFRIGWCRDNTATIIYGP